MKAQLVRSIVPHWTTSFLCFAGKKARFAEGRPRHVRSLRASRIMGLDFPKKQFFQVFLSDARSLLWGTYLDLHIRLRFTSEWLIINPAVQKKVLPRFVAFFVEETWVGRRLFAGESHFRVPEPFCARFSF